MQIDSNTIVTATEANQNFSKVARIAEKKGPKPSKRLFPRSVKI